MRLYVFARKILLRPPMDLNRHTSSDESGGNFSAVLSYYKRSSISSVETRNSDFRSEFFGFGRKSEILVSSEEMLDRLRFQLVIAKRYPEEMGFSGLEVTIIVPMAAITPLIAPQAT